MANVSLENLATFEGVSPKSFEKVIDTCPTPPTNPTHLKSWDGHNHKVTGNIIEKLQLQFPSGIGSGFNGEFTIQYGLPISQNSRYDIDSNSATFDGQKSHTWRLDEDTKITNLSVGVNCNISFKNGVYPYTMSGTLQIALNGIVGGSQRITLPATGTVRINEQFSVYVNKTVEDWFKNQISITVSLRVS